MNNGTHEGRVATMTIMEMQMEEGEERSPGWLRRWFTRAPRWAYIHLHHQGDKVVRLTRAQKAAVITCAILFAFSNFFYLASLKGGKDADWIQRNLLFLAASVTTSAILFVIGCLIYSISPFIEDKRVIAGLWLSWLIPLSIMFTVDRGSTASGHGALNCAGFLFVIVPLLVITQGFSFLYRRASRKTFYICLGAFLLVTPTILTIRFFIVQDEWIKGYNGESLENDGHCKVVTPNLNWNSLLPYRWLNFYTGSTTCGTEPNFATLTDGILRVDCDTEARVQVLSMTENWLLEQKSPVNFAENMFQRFVLNSTTTFIYNSPVPLSNAAVLVTCNGREQVLVQNRRDEDVISRKKTMRRNRDSHPIDDLNVLFINIDAFSRAHFLRRWPKTVQYLEDLTSAKAFQFFRYHSLGRSTVPNDQAMYLGMNEYDSGYSPKDLLRDPIWEDYNEAGKVTAYLDNSCLDWSTKYQYNRTSHTDYQMVAPFCLPQLHPTSNPFGPLVGPFSIRRRCLDNRYSHDIALDWLGQFVENHAETPYFAAAAFNEAHEGTGEVIGLMDEDFVDFLDRVDTNKTVVFIIADHGLHMSPYFALNLYSARAENMLPMGNLIVPNWVLENYPEISEALEENQQSLVTAYDLYATLKHLRHFEEKPNVRNGLSLFDKIPRERTCREANIPQDLCYCT
ncbi:hypothetical protein PROFUN_00104 [Planoprotostelium fungivorum]|uniref:Uncharacterized protein n=1 Tax=Planoprotostelium fungivorum TaxID=1890364 RepID=A0A2P6P0N0_9EUKA|nr:hypothetical protein PROFUN_00104 [Planoprotostelium fungivorum]